MRETYMMEQLLTEAEVADQLHVTVLTIQTLRYNGDLHDNLLRNMHMSPFEHQGTPDDTHDLRDGEGPRWNKVGLHGNFVGFIQYRKTIPGEAVAPRHARS